MRTPLVISLLSLAILIGIGLGLRPLLTRDLTPTPTPRPEVTVTIPEGWRREQIATLISKKGICPYADFISGSQLLEGRLFPDTYRFFPGSECKDVISTLTTTYSRRTTELVVSSQQLILASIIEREAQKDNERAIIASVYSNRFSAGMKLEADPTVQYGKDTIAWQSSSSQADFSFWKEITRADYQAVDSLFNTYQHAGLPPSPICNPGLKSLEAAVNPASSKYYYFFHRDGQAFFSETYTEHLRKLNQS